MRKERVRALLAKVTEWARREPAIIGVALVGSHARGEARPDSDVDLVLLSSDPAAFLRDTSWLAVFGELVSCEAEDWGRVTSLRAHFEDGLDVEFGLTTPDWAAEPMDGGTRQVVSRGMEILLDRDGALNRVRQAVTSTASRKFVWSFE